MFLRGGAAITEVKHQAPTSKRQRNTKSQTPNTNKLFNLQTVDDSSTILRSMQAETGPREYTEDTEKDV
jgi:hypothetical protein